MWEFPNGRVNQNPAEELGKVIKSGYRLRLSPKRGVNPFAIIKHTYSHFKVTVHAFRCEAASLPMPGNLRWVLLKKLGDFPMGKVDRMIAEVVISCLPSQRKKRKM